MCGIAGIVGTLDPPRRGHRRDAARARASRSGRRGHPSGERRRARTSATCRSSIWRAGGSRCAMPRARSGWCATARSTTTCELRQQLEARGHRFVTHSDCEVIIGLYEAYGDRLLEHLRGMFAFALWDSRKQRLLAARDHLGQKPFFYVAQPQRFAFGSEIKALLALDPSLAPLESRGIGSVSRAAPHCAAAHDVPRRREAAAGTSAHS